MRGFVWFGIALAIGATALSVMPTPALTPDVSEYEPMGRVEYKAVTSTPIGGEDSGVLRLQVRGIIRHDQETEGSPFAGNTQTCTGIHSFDDDGTPWSAAGYCDTVDADGHIWVLHYFIEGEESKWSVVQATGKFWGMSGSGTARLLPSPAKGMIAIEWKGKLYAY